MKTTEINKRENSDVVTIPYPMREEDIETARNAFEERKRVRWKQAWGASDVSEEDLNRQTSQTTRMLLRRGIDINTPGIYWIDLSNPSKYDHDACLAAARRGDRILNYDGTDHTGSILATERQRREQSNIDQITEEFISMMRLGELPPWKQPWVGGRVMQPRNAHGRRYGGINVFRLARIAQIRGYESPRWFTRKKAAKVGHPVREGEPGTLVFSMWYGPGADETEERIHTKAYMVFNWEQCEGVEKEVARQEVTVLPDAQTVIDKYLSKERQRRLKLDFQQSWHYGAHYRPSDDRMVVPHPDRFTDSSLYYLTAFHEVAHSTGHKKRLNRLEGNRPAPFDSHDYGQEELVAEMTAAFLAAATGLTFKGPVVEDSATYLNGWLLKMDEDASILLKAALKAQVAFNYVLKGERPPKRPRRRSSRK